MEFEHTNDLDMLLTQHAAYCESIKNNQWSIEPVTFDDIWRASIESNVITENGSSPRVYLVDSVRRGPAMSHDVSTIINAASQTNSKEVVTTKIPNTTVLHELSYLIRGLTYSEQIQILQSVQMKDRGRDIVIGSDVGGSSIYNLLIEQNLKNSLLLFTNSKDVSVEDAESTFASLMEKTGAGNETVQRCTKNIHLSNNFDQATRIFSKNALETILTEVNYDITISPLEMTTNQPSKKIDRYSAAKQTLSDFSEFTSFKDSPWFKPFLDSLSKALLQYNGSEEAAIRIINKVMLRNGKANQTLEIDPGQLAKTITTEVKNLGKEEVSAQLVTQVIRPKVDVGELIYEGIKHAVRKSNGQHNGNIMEYTTGGDALSGIIQMVGRDENSALGMQRFTDQRPETSFAIRKLQSFAKQRGKPIHAVIASHNNSKMFNVSILKPLSMI